MGPTAPTTPPRTTLPLPQSTPIKVGSSTTLPFTTTQKYRVESCTAMAHEMKKYIVGPMPAKQFLDDFFPTRLRQCVDYKSGCYDKTLKAAKEIDAYEPFIEASSKYPDDLKFVNSSSFTDCNPQLRFPFKIKPDVSVYPPTIGMNVKTDSSLAEIFIEFKWDTDDDPFALVSDLQNQSLLRDTKAAYDTLGQITSYAAAQLGAQFRTHVFSIFICRDTARLLRWDRSGAIVTETIKYNTSDILVDFFSRYAKAPPAMRGKDESVSDPSPVEEDEAREALQLGKTVPLVKLSIPIAGGHCSFVTSAPEAILYTPPGRATRGFKAYHVSKQEVVFLKDSWRINLQDIQAEGKVYEVLNSAQVGNVPHCIASGDISTAQYHATKTQDYVAKPWACRSATQFIPHRHYRLCLNLVGRVLVEYRSSYEMVSAVRDALVALKEAYDAGILHRDFSPANIIIDLDGHGWLIDWDLSKPVSSSSETPRRATRTGTWQFMSARLISQSSVQHDFRDDLESSLYVLLWMTLTYSEVSDKDQVPPFLASVLDPQPYGMTGGFGKSDFLKGRSFLQQVNFPNRLALHILIDKLAQLFRFRYESSPSESARKQTESLREMFEQSGNPAIQKAYDESAARQYDLWTAKLDSHQATIALFETALSNRSEWPANDLPVRQVFQPSLPTEPVLKTGWSGT